MHPRGSFVKSPIPPFSTHPVKGKMAPPLSLFLLTALDTMIASAALRAL
jgi:hypothetical protein